VKSRLKVYVLLHIMLMIYSMSGICSKMAAKQSFLSFKFCLFYGLVIFLLFFYAIGWQQIIKRMPLTVAFANKAVTIVWGLVWGLLFFHETITIGKLIGVLLVVCGIVIYAKSEEVSTNE
jgi:drug/metabolite transporter (DMT)-like permease